LIVIGGGSGGVGATIAAAREGVKTLLVEAQAWLGGTSTSGGVNCWEMGVGGTGIPFELYRRLRKETDAAAVYSCGRHFGWQPDGFHWPHALKKVNFPGGENVVDPGRHYADTLRRHPGADQEKGEAFSREFWHGVPFEPEALHRVVMEMLSETGNCEVRLNTRLVSVEAGDGRVTSVTLSDGATVTADAFIDGTGDGILCREAGCEQLSGIDPKSRFDEPGAPEQGSERVNAATLIFRVSAGHEPVIEPLPDGIPEEPWWREGPAVSCVNHYPNGDRNINMLPTMEGAEYMRLGEESARAECERRVYCHWHFLQTHFPEFQTYRLTWIAPIMGVRETTRTVCEAMLTENDIELGLSGQRDDDIIAIADHALDRHGEKGGCPEVREPYGIPYRSLIPKGMTNLLIACRGAGFSSIAASSCRLSRTMMQLGQAAGNAVALAKSAGIPLLQVSGEALREALRNQHVQLEFPLSDELKAYLSE
jgi:hypothetical protein